MPSILTARSHPLPDSLNWHSPQAEDGFCNAVRKAEVQGEIVNDRFKVTYFKLLKSPEKKEQPTTQKN